MNFSSSRPAPVMIGHSSRPASVGSATSDSNSSTFSSRGPRRGQEICIGEELRLAIDLTFERFKNATPGEHDEMEFPSSLTSTERAYIHRLAGVHGFKSKSKGKPGSTRCITVSKKSYDDNNRSSAALYQPSINVRQQVSSLLQRFPLTSKERQDLLPRTDPTRISEGVKELAKTTTGKLNNGLPQIPAMKSQSEVKILDLPIHAVRSEIIATINGNQVVMISGDTGCGKTTQVPQMILEDYCESRRPCRIFCTQPRRLAALSVAERVAAERGEKVGATVGYQIRLESRVSPKTLLTFCTNGILLRTIMGNDNPLSTVTHVIVDEVHERDKLSDFLLISLKQALIMYKNLKVVIMSATLNVDLFTRYFNGCPLISVPGSLFDVRELYLEDVLSMTGYSTKKMRDNLEQLQKKESGQDVPADLAFSTTDHSLVHGADDEHVASIEREMQQTQLDEEREELEPCLIKEMDDLLTEIWMKGDEDIFAQVFHLILSENVSADYQHGDTGITPLMAACSRGMINSAEKLIQIGANLNVKALQTGWTCLDVAKRFGHEDCVELLQSTSDEDDQADSSTELTPDEKSLLAAYHHSFDDEKVDHQLIMCLLTEIIHNGIEGAILVFLPGYDDLVSLKDAILFDDSTFTPHSMSLFTLHSNMQSSDQKLVFRRPPEGIRKIILATNIAETSITIDDVVHVIDSGKVKEKSFDALSGVSMLKCNWISKASSKQRAGRAGRCKPGVAYHLFSSSRYKNLSDYVVAEILRSPLQELCLHTKLLAPVGASIADFLACAPEPPSPPVTRNAIQILKQMDALDTFEDLTELGHFLVDLPIEPRLGKMILNAVVLKCLDPILTIACTLAYKEPFLLPSIPAQKRAAVKTRIRFSADTFSDHMAYLRVFQAWQRAKADRFERAFCSKNFVSSATMEMILGMRTQILGQLRASGFVRARGSGDIRDLNNNSENWAAIKAAMCAGIYPNLVRVNKGRLYSQKENKVRFHQTSVLSPSLGKQYGVSQAAGVRNLPTEWLVYEEMSRSGSGAGNRFASAQVRCATAITSIAVAIFAGVARLPLEATKEIEGGSMMMTSQGDGLELLTPALSSDSESEDTNEATKVTIKLDDWISFRCDMDTATLLLQLRQKWHALFLRRMTTPHKPLSQADEAVIRTVVCVLTSEEQASSLQQPTGIGQRPKPMSNMDSLGLDREGHHSDDSSSSSDARPGRRGRHSYTGGHKKKPIRSNWYPDDQSETSSVRSSAPSSRLSSTSNSPCASPGPSSKLDLLSEAKSPLCRYFILKCNSQKSLDISMNKSIWATTSANEAKLVKSLQEKRRLYLIFSVQGSGHFQGIAQLTGVAAKDRCAEFGIPGLSVAFSVQWIKRSNLPFQATHHLLNPWNEDKKVQISRDGQELEPSVGEELVHMWDSLPHIYPKGCTSGGSQSGVDDSTGLTPPVSILHRQHSP